MPDYLIQFDLETFEHKADSLQDAKRWAEKNAHHLADAPKPYYQNQVRIVIARILAKKEQDEKYWGGSQQ